MDRLSPVEGFNWDEGNIEKNWEKHHVSYVECEEVFLSRPLLVAEDERHSQDEARCYVLGKTREGRHLFVVFTIRHNKIRAISARDMSRKEKRIYEEKTEGSPEI